MSVANAKAITRNWHRDHQDRIDRRASDWTVAIRQVPTEIEEPVEFWTKTILGSVASRLKAWNNTSGPIVCCPVTASSGDPSGVWDALRGDP
jgi:hypothetical protein